MDKDRLTLDDQVRPCDDVVFRELDGEAVLLDLQTGIYFGLNQTGTRIWTLLQKEGSLRQVLAALQEQYAVPVERLEADLLDLISRLRAKNLVVDYSSTPA